MPTEGITLDHIKAAIVGAIAILLLAAIVGVGVIQLSPWETKSDANDFKDRITNQMQNQEQLILSMQNTQAGMLTAITQLQQKIADMDNQPFQPKVFGTDPNTHMPRRVDNRKE